MLKKSKKYLASFGLVALIFSFSLFLFSQNVAFAQEVKPYEPVYFTPQIEVPNSAITGKVPVGEIGNDGYVSSTLLAKYIEAIYNYGLGIGGVLATVMLMVSGLIWLTSAGDSGKIDQAKKLMTGSIVGMVLLYGAFLLLNTINPDLVKMKGVRVIGIDKVSEEIIYCCHPKNGSLKAFVKTIDGKKVFVNSTDITNISAGDPYAGCWETLKAEECNPGNGSTCMYDDNAKSYICNNPNDICCGCSFGNSFMMNRYNTCKEHITTVECEIFCAEELSNYNKTNNKDYSSYNLSNASGFGHINPGVYTCQNLTSGIPKGSTCRYKTGSGGEW